MFQSISSQIAPLIFSYFQTLTHSQFASGGSTSADILSVAVNLLPSFSNFGWVTGLFF
jgi:hypothetical protein